MRSPTVPKTSPRPSWTSSCPERGQKGQWQVVAGPPPLWEVPAPCPRESCQASRVWGQAPMNCRCLAQLTCSSMRTRVKLAGMKDMANTMQKETSTSTEEAILGAGLHELLRAEICMSLMGPRSTRLVTGRGDVPSHFGMRVDGSFGRERLYRSTLG